MNWEDFLAGSSTGTFFAVVSLIVLVVVWTFVWKGLALWKSARLGNKVWFVVFLLVNTLGILEILYLYFFSRKPNKPVESPTQTPNP